MWKRVTLLSLFVLFWNFNTFSIGKIDVPEEYYENMTVSGFDSDFFEYDFNKDGVKEKILVNSKKNGLKAEAAVSIYIFEENRYRFAFQISLKDEINIFSMERAKDNLKKIKEHYNDYSKDLKINEIRYVEILDDNTNEQIVFDIKFDKHSPKNLDNFIFVKKTAVFTQMPNNSSEVAFVGKYKDKPKILLEFVSVKDNEQQLWYLTEIEKNSGKIKGYISGNQNNILKRGFYWDEMYSKIKTVNNFINDSLKNETDLYIITQYRPLANDYYSPKDRFGNRNNQSITGYTNANKNGEKINIPDQTIFRITGREDEMIKIETPLYGGPYYIDDKPGVMKKIKINEKVNKFITIDPESQTEAIIERVGSTDNFAIISYSFVTTGRDNGFSSYETPHGAFLVAFTRPYMMFTRSVKKDEDLSLIPRNKRVGNRDDIVVAGEAKYAVRFSGGAYMHGIPASYGENREAIKAVVAQKIGTYKESHKCVRHHDDQIEFIVNWINGKSTTKVRDNTIPDEPVIAVVL
ncbi:L,D-transpeptidase [Leptotrichia sp. OH3620_COT-345]|uniref:L,D-transpeptidase n=1 Tax=Leptotrichia sp. OH3620_COT-345 TaxID=2491048 RepID=UPI000F6517AA|nr:L,D-transpeptidase [Leptotrichia sp. OH3620_COT-345]RRD38277.1 L,D-transpeptidase [Leptotrichia sp. OH3620_COT-345]